MVFGPLIGKAADKFGKFKVFLFGSALSIVMVVVYTHLEATPLAAVVLINVVMFVGIFSRMIPFQALVSQVPEATKRGAFNAISASIQQVSGGIASLVAGHIVTQGAGRPDRAFPGRGLRGGGHHAGGHRPGLEHPAPVAGARRRGLSERQAARQARMTGIVKLRPISVWANR
jgi:MFS family permease